MRKIYKYPIQDDFTSLELPKDSQVLTIQTQNGKPFIWVLHDTDLPTFKWKFIIVATGENIEDEGIGKDNYIGTFQMMEGLLVWHLFGYIEVPF